MDLRLLVSIGFMYLTATVAIAQHPNLPDEPYDYVAYAVTDLPEHYKDSAPYGDAGLADNTPVDNPITNDGATLGRVLFYDKRLSIDDTVSCSSCHTQATGFTDPNRFSVGVAGLTGRHSMSLTNAKFYINGRFFWDERAETLEDQVLMPIQDPVEMGMNLDDLRRKLALTRYYGPLFANAFGTPEITNERISAALAQFVRSLVSYNSKYDSAFAAGSNGQPDFAAVYTAEELLGIQLFDRLSKFSVRCDRCHESAAHIADRPRNIGLNFRTTSDQGAGNGTFKVPSLRNVEVREHYMHDGRFTTLEQVIDFYDTDVEYHPHLDNFMRRDEAPGARPARLNLTHEEKAAMVAFLKTLTDRQFLTDEKFSDPFSSN